MHHVHRNKKRFRLWEPREEAFHSACGEGARENVTKGMPFGGALNLSKVLLGGGRTCRSSSLEKRRGLNQWRLTREVRSPESAGKASTGQATRDLDRTLRRLDTSCRQGFVLSLRPT